MTHSAYLFLMQLVCHDTRVQVRRQHVIVVYLLLQCRSWPGDQAQAIRLGSKCLLPPSHLVRPQIWFMIWWGEAEIGLGVWLEATGDSASPCSSLA